MIRKERYKEDIACLWETALSIPKCRHLSTVCSCMTLPWHIGCCFCSANLPGMVLWCFSILFYPELALCNFYLFNVWWTGQRVIIKDSVVSKIAFAGDAWWWLLCFKTTVKAPTELLKDIILKASAYKGFLMSLDFASVLEISEAATYAVWIFWLE